MVKRLLHFSQLVTPVMTNFMRKLTVNFTERFEGFSIPIEVLQFARDPFSIKPEADFCVIAKEVRSWIDESILQMEMLDVLSSFALKQHLLSEGAVNLWCNHVSQYQYPTIRKVVLLGLTMFGSTYTCESSFSHMNEKLHECLRVALTTYKPNYVEIAKSRQYNFSH